MSLLPYFPLACGLLTGKYQRNAPLPAGSRITGTTGYFGKYLTDRNWDVVEALTAFAQARGHTLLDLACSWILASPLVPSLIAGATRVEQVEQNVAAASWALSAADLAEIDRITSAG
jgi:aryl-alcohol dehydrogenase-like predicted oxidoreductase